MLLKTNVQSRWGNFNEIINSSVGSRYLLDRHFEIYTKNTRKNKLKVYYWKTSSINASCNIEFECSERLLGSIRLFAHSFTFLLVLKSLFKALKMQFTSTILIHLILSQAITLFSLLSATEVTSATTKLQNEPVPNDSLSPQYNTIGQLNTDVITMKASPAPTTAFLSAEYELPTKLKVDWKINDSVYFTLLNNEVVKGVVTYVDSSFTTNNQAYIVGNIVTTKIGKNKNTKILAGSFNAAYLIDSISASITLIAELGFLYELKPAVVNKSKSPLKKTYTVTKKDYSSFPPDGEPPMVSSSTKHVESATILSVTKTTATEMT